MGVALALLVECCHPSTVASSETLPDTRQIRPTFTTHHPVTSDTVPLVASLSSGGAPPRTLRGCYRYNCVDIFVCLLGDRAHIRQLVYIALCPPPSIEDQIEEEALKLEPGSPSKLLSRRHKSSLAPSPKASAAALDLLNRFANTNTPESLACALPSYPDDPNFSANDGRIEELEDSFIAQRALRIRNARCCWEIIKEGFVQRSDSDVMSSPRKPRPRRSTRTRKNPDDGGEEDEECDTPDPVSDHAWGVLGWLLTLFERDEVATERNGQVRYSPLLLSQVPPSRATANAPRWDVELPLDVAFHALKQDGQAQQRLGIRLLTLFINLTSTNLLDVPMFLNAVSTRVSSLSFEALSYLFESLPPTQTLLQFKIMLCRHALGGYQAPNGSRNGRPKPQARARPPPRRRVRTDPEADGSATAATGGEAAPAETPPSTTTADCAGEGGGTPSVARKYTNISASDVLELLARPSKSDGVSPLLTLCFKSVLVTSYAALQRLLPAEALEKQEDGDRDVTAGWQGVVRDGSLKRAVEDAFDSGRGSGAMDEEQKEFARKMRDALLTGMSMW